MLALLGLVLFGCETQEAKCRRLAPRLMPTPTEEFIRACADRCADPKALAAVDCLLAVKGGIYDADLQRCKASDVLPLYFQF